MRTFMLFLALFTVVPAAAAQETDAAPDLLVRIGQAKKHLTGSSIGTNRIGGENAVLAVWKPTEPEKKIRLVTVRGGISRTRGFAVSLERKNGVNSRYRVTSPEGFIVLALKTNIKNRHGRGRSKTAIYVPYSPDLNTPETRERGRKYLLNLVDRASDALDNANVRSVVDPDAMVTEMVPMRILLTLLVIEHITPSEFESEGAAPTIDRVLATVGLNGEDSYDFAVSDARAGGIAQFIAETYKLTRNRYPLAKLLKDFVEGMRDHRNAVKAQYCLADWSIGRLSSDARHELIDGTREEDLGAWLAAAYNGGEEKASRVYDADPLHWEKDGHGLAKQTVTYVREFRTVYKLLFNAEAQTETPDH